MDAKQKAMTLLEMVLALSLMAVFFAVFLPHFRILYKSWGLKEASAETVQNERVLLDHCLRHLATASQLTAVSDGAESLGYLEYLDRDGATWRYEVGPDDFVYYGQPGDLSILAGPVSQFQWTGYALTDLQHPVSDPLQMRLLRVQITCQSPTDQARSLAVSSSVLLRTDPSAVIPPADILLVVRDPSSLSSEEQALRVLIESFGYSILMIDESASQNEYDTALALCRTAYVPGGINAAQLGSKLRNTGIGVVNENRGQQYDQLGFCSQDGNCSESSIDVVDNTHYLTQVFTVGSAAVVTASTNQMCRMRGTMAAGMQVLARRPGRTEPVLGILETGAIRYDGQTSAGRRVNLPWGGNRFSVSQLNANGRTLLWRAIAWAGNWES